MTMSRLTTSLFAMALFAMPALAGQATVATDQPAAVQTQQSPADIAAFLKDTRAASELSDAELKQRLITARGFLKLPDLGKDLRRPLARLAKAAREEIAARRQGQGQQKTQGDQQTAPAVGAADTAAGTDTQQQKPAKEVLPIGSQVPDDVMAFIADDRPLSQLTRPELISRFKTAKTLSRDTSLPADQHIKLVKIFREARIEVLARRQAGKQGAAGQQTKSDAAAAGDQQPDTAQPPATAADQKQAQALDGNTADPDTEAKAKTFLDGSVQVEKLSAKELRTRLQAMRAVLAGNKLSQATERALRLKLRADRDVLRARVASGGDQNNSQTKTNVTNVTNNITNIDVKVILADRRPSGQLADNDLRRRIDVYRDAVVDVRYNDQDRMRWRQVMDQDRKFLRLRLIEARRKRAQELTQARQKGTLNIDIGVNLQSGRPPQRDVFAAEVGDEELENVLVAPARRPIERRYTLAEVESSPELRDAIPRIEIDTVHFGFGESFVREEEVGNLDHIAEVLEKILTAHPREVFIIEGHTDAVGSDEANLALSRLRAEAIKQALVTFYVIPDANLDTVGYGERYLKIPTAEAEAENRRVSIARATPLVGELGQ